METIALLGAAGNASVMAFDRGALVVATSSEGKAEKWRAPAILATGIRINYQWSSCACFPLCCPPMETLLPKASALDSIVTMATCGMSCKTSPCRILFEISFQSNASPLIYTL